MQLRKWVSGTSKIVLCIWCYHIICCNNVMSAYNLSTYANVSHSSDTNWLINEGAYASNDNFIVRIVLYSEEHTVHHYNPSGFEIKTDYYPPFGFGLFAHQTAPTSFMLAIYMGTETSPVIVWCANQDRPVQEGATLDLTPEDGLLLRDEDGSLAWSTNTFGLSVSSMHLKPDGNLVLFNARGKPIWESYHHPTNTLLRGQNFSEGQRLTSRSNTSAVGFYVSQESDGLRAFVDLNPPQEYMYLKFSVMDYFQSNYKLGFPENYYNEYIRLDQNGQLNQYEWNQGESLHSRVFQDGDFGDCVYPITCGKYGVCTNRGQCGCPVGNDGNLDYFMPSEDFNPNSGCTPVNPISCPDTLIKRHTFLELVNVSYFASTPSLVGVEVDRCKSACLKNCSCKGVFFHYYSGNSLGNCTLPTEILTLMDVSGGRLGHSVVAYIKVQNTASSKASLRKILVGSISAFVVVTGVCFYVLLIRRRNKAKETDHSLDIFIDTLSRFSFESLKAATQDFQTRLGRGGFGSVFEGTLADERKVAVKKLESLGQGRKEFLAEVNTIGSLHHFNLVKLIGFCDDGFNRLLVYEYMCNGSLEKWIFNQDLSQALHWSIRRRIIDGVAVGLEYLHEHCKQNIIHFDIKPQNILLDKDFNVKIADFGLAKLVDRDQNQVMTIVKGTPGYMAPELITGRAISCKVDVYSFGVLVLEIVCGRRNYGSLEGDCLTSLVKMKADEDKLSDLIDMGAEDMQQNKQEAVKMMKIAIWCLQPHFIRPTMSMVVKVLQDHPNMESLTDLSYLTMVHEATPPETNYDFSVRPTESLLSGPR